MNKVILIGRLSTEPQLRENEKYKQVKFTLAVKKEKIDGADFISCMAWGSTADIINKYLHKGNQIAIEGRIQTGSYEAHDGTKRYTTDVVIENLTFLEKKISEEPKEPKKEEKDIFKEFSEEIELEDEDLPF